MRGIDRRGSCFRGPAAAVRARRSFACGSDSRPVARDAAGARSQLNPLRRAAAHSPSPAATSTARPAGRCASARFPPCVRAPACSECVLTSTAPFSARFFIRGRSALPGKGRAATEMEIADARAPKMRTAKMSPCAAAVGARNAPPAARASTEPSRRGRRRAYPLAARAG